MLPECYIYVYDTVRDENRWVNKSYVEYYDDDDDYNDMMDGDFDSGMASAGYGTDEDYGYYGGEDDDYGYYGEDY